MFLCASRALSKVKLSRNTMHLLIVEEFLVYAILVKPSLEFFIIDMNSIGLNAKWLL